MGSPSHRVVRTLVAGAIGVAQSVLVLVATLVIGVFAMQAGLQWYARGSIALFPSATPAANRSADVAVLDASPSEARAIRRAVAALKYRVPPSAVTFRVVSGLECPDCQGVYRALSALIELNRDLVDTGGAPLQQAVAHEVGHYVDFSYLYDAQRDRYKALRGIPARVTWNASAGAWTARPDEDFAEVFATLALPAVVSPPRTSYGRIRDPDAIRRLLAGVGVRFDRNSTQAGLRPALEQAANFLVFTLEASSLRFVLYALIALFVVLNVASRMRAAWQS